MNLLMYIATCCATLALATQNSDLQRARTKLPSSHLIGADALEATSKLNAAIRARHVHTLPCEDFTVENLIRLQRELHAMVDPEFERIYQATADNRRMAAFGTHKYELKELEAEWAQRRSILKAEPGLHNITRDTLCIETVKWVVHHIPSKMLQSTDKVVPLLAVTKASSFGKSSIASHASSSVVESYKATVAFQACHSNVSAVTSDHQSMAASGVAPAHPLAWPSTFEAHLTEARDAGNVTGMHFYDSTMLREIIKRDTGKYDQLCGTATGYPNNSPCANLAVSGKRYVFWPEEKQCCLCCTDRNGCGAVTKVWTNTATYQGQRYFDGRLCDFWLIMGGNHNYYYQDAQSGLPVAVQMTDKLGDLGETFIWHPETAKFNQTIDQSVFHLPDYCSNSEQHLCPGWCAMLRNNSQTEAVVV